MVRQRVLIPPFASSHLATPATICLKFEELPDWQQRFVIEYKELLSKTAKLGNMLNNWDNLNFVPKCSKPLLMAQYNIMSAYLSILEERSKIENIDLENLK